MDSNEHCEMPEPGPQHEILARFAGSWVGEETMHPSPFDPEGSNTTSTLTAKMGLGGFFLLSEYEQRKDGEVSFNGHGVYGFDPLEQRLTMHWFDTMGFDPGAPATGNLEGDHIVFMNHNRMGHGRFTYTFRTADHYTFKMEMSEDGENWMPMMEADYKRA